MQAQIIGEQIRRAHILSQRVAEVATPQECLGEADAHRARAGVNGTRLSVLDGGLGVLAGRHVPISAVQKVLSSCCRIAPAAAAQREETEQGETPG